MNLQRILRLVCGLTFLWGVFSALFLSTPGYSNTSGSDAKSLEKLRTFLFDAAARQKWSKDRPDAQNANSYLESFPPQIQQELLEIVMMIMHEKKEKAMSHVRTFRASGAQAAQQSFSPEVNARIQRLVGKLQNDKKFNTKNNLQRMRRGMQKIK